MPPATTMCTSRREFLERLGLLGAGGLITAAYTATARGYAANETIEVGVIGCGGRAQHLLRYLLELPGVRLAAVADVWDKHLDDGRRLADPRALVTRHANELLDRRDLDAVLIATPDHWHVPMTVAACEAGKDVYVEKPLTHNLAEGAAVIDAQNRHQRIVQVGMQQRSMPHLQEARELVRSGQLGRVHKVRMSWNRNADRLRRGSLGIDPASVDWAAFVGAAREQPFDEYRFRNWRWFWDFGGGILTDLMTHFIDVANWYLDLAEPATAVTVGDFYTAADLWETPDTIQTLLDYPDEQVQLHFEGTFVNARDAARLELLGSEASLYVDRGRYELHPEPRSQVASRELVLGEGPRGRDFYMNPPGETLHLANWLESIRTREKPNAPAEAGVTAVLGPHLGNLAYRRGARVSWGDAVAQQP